MKKMVLFLVLFTSLTILPSSVFAQGMMGFSSSSPDNATIQSQQQEEQEGKRFLDDLNNKKTTCSQLKDVDFEKIGEYFMGQAIGDTSRHIAMNEMMKGMMGEQGEEQMHIAWGKRGSGCDTSSQGTGFMPMMGMMQMMGGGGNPMMGYSGWNNMMGGWGGFGLFGWISMIIFWILLILVVVVLIRYLSRSGQSKDDKTPLDILKERYARGEIDKKEFSERRKDL
ncbi:MAG: SHOCT domain-containing protein [Patescibacteria group bacterium]|nr:SHOCT domain-containing protein [Patescibacteria group bacterium]